MEPLPDQTEQPPGMESTNEFETPVISPEPSDIPTQVEIAASELEALLYEIKRVIVGQEHMVERLVVALLTEGHILLEGLPGVAKTLAVSTMSKCVGGSYVRLQFTPDLLPSDLVGTRIWKANTETFDLEWGPIFANFVLTDEINRAPAKVQSALLEVMAEGQVSMAGQTRKVPEPFLVLATQNPLESEGVYPLPEAQQDRFMMKVIVDHPDRAQEIEILHRMASSTPDPSEVMPLERVKQIQQLIPEIYVDSSVSQYAVDIVMATRNPGGYQLQDLDPVIEVGVSPRATLALIAGARALALLQGRHYVTAQDVFDIARDVLRHRLILSFEALARSVSTDDVINRILSIVPASETPPLSK